VSGGAAAASATGGAGETNGLDATVLASGARGDGRHHVLRARIGGRDVVVKLYGRKRSATRDVLRDLGQRLFVGKSGVRADRRAATERRVLETWRREGFDVPALVEGVVLPPQIVQPSVVMEFVPGRLFDECIADPALPLAEKSRLVTRIALDLARRHARARALREPLLIQVHATLRHVLHVAPAAGAAVVAPAAGAAVVAPAAGAAVAGQPASSDERLVTFDFEVAWTRRHGLDAMARQEFTHYRDSLASCALPQQHAALERAFDDGYAERDVATLARGAAQG
jgi:hypothetical protein